MEGSYRYLLVLEGGQPADPPAYVTDRSDWQAGDRFISQLGQTFVILEAADLADGPEVLAHLFQQVWTVRAVSGGALE